MERTGALREVWRGGVAMNQVMQGSCQLLPWLGPPGQILPQQEAPLHSSVSTSCSTALSCHFQSGRRGRQRSSDSARSIARNKFLRWGPVNRLVNPNSSKQIEAGVESNQTARRSPDGGAHLLSDSHATHGKSGTTLEPAYVVLERARSSQNGAHPAVHNYPVQASRMVACLVRQTSGVTNLYSSSLKRVQKEILTFRDECSFQRRAARLDMSKTQSPNCKHRREAKALAGSQGTRRRGNNVAQLEAASPQTRSGSVKCREAAKIIEPNRNTLYKVVGETQSLHQNTDSLKWELERVGDIKANITRSRGANDALEIREQETLAREEGQSSAISEQRVTENRQDLLAEELLRKAHWMDGRSTPAWANAGLNLTTQGRLQSHASYGTRDWSQDTEQGNRSTHMHSAGTTSEAITVLKTRLQRGVTTDSYTYVKVLQMCLKQKDLVVAKEVHDCIIKSRMDQNPYVAETLLNVYIKCGKLLDARQVFDELEKKSVINWNMMIGGYAKSGCADSALQLFKLMRQEGPRPNKVTYLCILKACTSPLTLTWGKKVHHCIRHAGFESDVRVGTALLQMYAKCGCITEARQVFEKLASRNLITWTTMIGAYATIGNMDEARVMFDRMEERDLVAWNIMIAAYAQLGHGVEAYRLFLQMRREGFEPDAFTYASILSVSATEGPLEWVKDVHGHVRKAGLESDLRVGNALIHIYAKSGGIGDARLVFDRMEKRDVVTWNTMIGGLAQHGCGQEALELFRTMNADLMKANRTTFVAVLSACCHGGLLDDGRRLLSAMTEDYGIEPDIIHYTCMVDLLGRAGHLEEAKRFIRDMPAEPDVVTWKALLGACRTHGNVELGELAAKEVFKLEPNNISGYVLLSNIYAAAGKWEKVSVVRTMMQERGVRKEPGRSWIKVDNEIHEFVVGDTSHPEARAIYTELNKLTKKLKAEGYIPDTQHVLQNINEEDKELALCSHSEKLAIVYGLMRIPRGEPIRVNKNLRVCADCHTATKFISKVTEREIITRDGNRFHHFKDGVCSCGDYW